MFSRRHNILFGQVLVDSGLITPQNLDDGLREQKKSGGFICTMLVRMGVVDKTDAFTALSGHLNIPYIDLKNFSISKQIIEKVSGKIAYHYRIIPIKFEPTAKELTVAMIDPLDVRIVDDLSLFLNVKIVPALAYESDILDAIKKFYGIGADTLEKMMDKRGAEIFAQVQQAKQEGEQADAQVQDASVTRLVDQIMREAIKDRATDIHIEPYPSRIRVRFRIDGILYDIKVSETIKHFFAAIVSRIKIMAGLNIAERRLPQDGRLKIKIGQEELDLRVSIMPSTFGETVHIRILSSQFFLELNRLGMLADDLHIIEEVIKKPHGIICVTGPTGSGKSTTLYACLSRLNSAAHKIITIEDPVEYRMEGITQMQVHHQIGFDFASGLRHILRHDPDIIMVGEVRDFETAEIAIRSALTGHLVFSTLHTNDAAGTVTRLLDMGLEPFLLSSSFECLIAQRLIRIICPDCKQPAVVDSKLLNLLTGQEQKILAGTLQEGKGCANCRFTGFRGRTGIYEVIMVNEAIRKLILSRASSQQIKQEAVACGMRTLRGDGIQKIAAGITTLSEVIRVTSLNE